MKGTLSINEAIDKGSFKNFMSEKDNQNLKQEAQDLLQKLGVPLEAISKIKIDKKSLYIFLKTVLSDKKKIEKIRNDMKETLLNRLDCKSLEIFFEPIANVKSNPSKANQPKMLQGFDVVLAISSGKGGVGKSTIAFNLAVALTKIYPDIALIDCDIYGPSIPALMGVESKAETEGEKILPIRKHGIQVMSLGFLLEDDAPAIWRGPMLIKAIYQLCEATKWSFNNPKSKKIAILDLPPGTGDVVLTLSKDANITHAIIVSQPHNLSIIDAVKARVTFEKLGIKVLGAIANMVDFICPKCSATHNFFGKKLSEIEKELAIKILGNIPMDKAISEAGEKGLAVIDYSPNSAAAVAFTSLANNVQNKI